MRVCIALVLTTLVLAPAGVRAQQNAPEATDPPAPPTQAEPEAAPAADDEVANDGQAPAPAEDAAGSEPAAEAEPDTAEPQAAQADADVPLPDPSEAPVVPMDESAALTAAELAELGIDNINEASLDTDLHFSGFMDATYSQLLNPEQAPLTTAAQGAEGSFFVGRLNLYLTKNITEAFSMMAEVRFTYAPNGTSGLSLGATPASTETVDYSRSALTFRWGGIVVERAYGEWSPLPYFNVRAGAFLTPYGIWNVDHGTPVFITVSRPFAVGGNFFPERQTGLEMFGRVALTSNLTGAYHLTISNGLGPVSEYRDLDSNKALGSRLVLEHVGDGSRFHIGGSTFWGESSAGLAQVGLNADGSALVLNQSTVGNSEVLSLAADVRWMFRGFLLQSEWVGQRWEYKEDGRTPLAIAGQLGIPPDALPADYFGWGGYILAGYRLPWWGIMPFATLEYVRSYNVGIRSRTALSQMGLNVRPKGPIVFKAQYEMAFAGSPGTEGKSIALQLAWAF